MLLLLTNTVYLKFQDYPDSVIQKFLQYEIDGKPDDDLPDPDILLEMHRPIKDMKEIMPSVINDIGIDRMIDVCIEKKFAGTITTNKQFRLISKSLNAVKSGELSSRDLEPQIRRFFAETEYTTEELYHNTSEGFYKYQTLLKTSKSLFDLLDGFEFQSLDSSKRNILERELELLLDQIRGIR